MKDKPNEERARVLEFPSPEEGDIPNGRWSIKERDQLLLREREARLEAEVMSKDITAEKRAEEAVRKAEQRYRDILDNVEEGIFQTSPEGRFILVNRGLARILGFDSPEELIAERTDIANQHYVHPERRREFTRLLSQTDMVSGFELEAYRKDGSKIWLSENVRAVRDDQGNILYYEGTTQDINERKRAETRSAAFAQLARKLSGARTPIDAGRIIAQTAGDLFEWDSCNLDLYDADHDLIHPMLNIDTIDGQKTDVTALISDRAPTPRGRRVIAHGAELLLREEPIQFDEDAIPFGDAGRPSASIMSVPIRHADRVIGLLSIQSYTPRAYDAAALSDFQALADHCGEALNRIRAEEELRESEERFRQLSEAPFEAIILHDKGTILEVNQPFCRMYGYERAEVIGKSVLDLALPEFRELLLQKVRVGDSGSYEGPALRKDGTTFRAELAGKPIHYQGRGVRVAAIRDVTEQKRNERRQAAQYAVTRVLAESATLAEATPQLLRAICESLRWKMGEFWRLGDKPNFLRCGETWHIPGLEATSFIEASRQTELAPGDGLPGRVWQSGQPAWIPDVMTDPRFARAAIAAKLGLRGAVAFPILLGNQTLGVMLFFSRRAPEVDEELLKIMSAIGSQIGQFTERKRAEAALLASEHKYRDIFTFAPVGIYQSLRDGTLITANKALAEMLDYASVDELLRINLGSGIYLSEDERERLIGEYEGLGYAGDLDMQWKRKDGSPICVQLSAHAIKGPNGETEYFEGFVRDITERKRSQEALRESEERYRDLVENSRELICTHDLDGRVLSANRAAAETLGYDSNELLEGKNIRDILAPEVRHEFEQYMASLRERGATSGIMLVETSTGERRMWEYYNSLRTDGVTTPIVRGMARDITDRKLAEQALLASERKYRDIFTFAPVGIYQSLRDGTIITANHTLAEMLGYASVDELLRVELARDVYLVEGERERLIREHEARGYPIDLELQWKAKDGSPIWVQLSAHAIKGVNGATEYWEGFVRDITERKRSEEALRESEERYRDLVENSREFICTHDLDGLILSANRAASEVLGYDLKDCCGKKNFRELLVPEVRDQFDDYLARLRRDGFASGLTLVQTSFGERRILEYHNTVRTEGVATPIVRGMARDITEQRRAENAISDLRRELELTMNSMEEGVHRVDMQGNIAFENPAAARMLGWEVHELLGRPAHLTMHHTRPDGSPYPRQECPIYSTLSDGITRQVADEVFWRRDGTNFPVEYVTAPMRNDRNEIVAVVVTFRDITERKRAEESLQLFRNLIDQSNDAIEVIDPITLRFIDCNESAYRSLGYTREELLSLTVFDIDPVVDRSSIAELNERIQESGFVTFESVHQRKDGTTFPVEINVKLVMLERIYRLAVVRDISSRKQTEEALRESEERYRELFENAKDAIYVHDLGGRYVSVNRAAEQLCGFTREEILGKHFSNFVSPRDLKHVRTNLCRKLDEENETVYEVNIVNRNGLRIPVEVSSRLIYEKGMAVGVQGTARDITDRKRAQEALRIFSQRLIEAQEAERQKIARELHDEIGQVLTAVRINLQSVQRSRATEEGVRPLDESIAIVDEALGRVRELSLELRPSLLDDLGLSAALRWYVDRYAQRTGIVARVLNGFKEDGRLPRELETACFRIAQEALTNVARHAQASNVSVQLERSRETILLTITDDGIGFDINKLRKSASAASSLGLRGMEERALVLGGYIEIESGSERGTLIRATFPLRR